MNKLPVVKIFNSRIEAEIARGYLQSFGIKTEIISDDAGQSYPSFQSIRGVRLLTSKENLKKAKELLELKENVKQQLEMLGESSETAEAIYSKAMKQSEDYQKALKALAPCIGGLR